MLRTGVIGLAAALAMAATATAQAQSVTNPIDGRSQTVVRIHDLNPATADGAAAMRTRLRTAAETVCGPRPQNPADLTAAAQFRTCVQETYTTALATAPSAQQMATRQEPRTLR